MAVDKSKMISLLAHKVSPSKVAASVGCSQQYINECLANPDFRKAVVEAQMDLPQEEIHTTIDKQWDNLEALVVSALTSQVSTLDTKELLAAARIANAAKRRGDQSADFQLAQAAKTMVSINLPQAMVVNYTKNVANEITSVEGRPMITIGSSELLQAVAVDQAKITNQRILLNDPNSDPRDLERFDPAGVF